MGAVVSPPTYAGRCDYGRWVSARRRRCAGARGPKDSDEPVELALVDIDGIAMGERATYAPPPVDLVGRDISEAEPDELAVHVVGDAIDRRRLHLLHDLFCDVIEAELMQN